jgi:hypothetical protein
VSVFYVTKNSIIQIYVTINLSVDMNLRKLSFYLITFSFAQKGVSIGKNEGKRRAVGGGLLALFSLVWKQPVTWPPSAMYLLL